MKITIRACLCAVVSSAVPASPSWAAEPGDGLEEVHVEGTPIHRLRIEMEKAEDRFFDIYNSLSHDWRYKVSCKKSARTGTRLTARSCTSAATDRATEQAARDFLAAMEMNASLTQEADAQRQNAQETLAASAAAAAGPGGALAMPAAVANQAPYDTAPPQVPNSHGNDLGAELQEHERGYNENVEEMIRKHPELRERAEEYSDARKRYEEALRRQAGGAGQAPGAR